MSFWSDGSLWEIEFQVRSQCTAIGFKKAKMKESSGTVLYQGLLCSLINTCTRKMTPQLRGPKFSSQHPH